MNAESAQAKMTDLMRTSLFTEGKTPVAFIIGLNGRAEKADLKKLGGECLDLARFMEQNRLFGGAYPFVWKSTVQEEGGYTFPFLRSPRSLMTLHPGAQAVHRTSGTCSTSRSFAA